MAAAHNASANRFLENILWAKATTDGYISKQEKTALGETRGGDFGLRIRGKIMSERLDRIEASIERLSNALYVLVQHSLLQRCEQSSANHERLD